MATTEILYFDSTQSNMQPQGNYAGSVIQLDGFLAGSVDPTVLNKILEQTSFMSAGLANWMVSQGITQNDDGNLNGLVSNLSSALITFVSGGGAGVPLAQVGIYAGNPNGYVAGSVGSAGTIAPSFVWDPTDAILWVCTATGNSTAAVWTGIGANANVISWTAPTTSSSITASAGVGYLIDTTSNVSTVTLPGSPSFGNLVGTRDVAGTWGTNPVTLAPSGGLKIEGVAANLVLNVPRASYQWLYSGSTYGWVAT